MQNSSKRNSKCVLKYLRFHGPIIYLAVKEFWTETRLPADVSSVQCNIALFKRSRFHVNYPHIINLPSSHPQWRLFSFFLLIFRRWERVEGRFIIKVRIISVRFWAWKSWKIQSVSSIIFPWRGKSIIGHRLHEILFETK